QDASLVSQLRSQGAIIVGKTNMDEYANNISGINNNYGVIKNPRKENYTVGGSSGGSAVSVAANLAYASIGTDTAGSVRIPASCCCVFGLKPTYNLIPTEGITPLSPSFDHAGIFTKNSEDLFSLLKTLVPGKQDFKEDLNLSVQGLKVGYLVDYDKNNNEELELAKDDLIRQLKSHGAEIKSIKTKILERYMETH